jgi:hypothetical protein
VLGRLLGGEEPARLADDDRHLKLVVEFPGELLWIDDRILGADDRVHILEEDDALVDRVRPVDPREVLVVLAEVPRSVEELLRHDRRAQPHPVRG